MWSIDFFTKTKYNSFGKRSQKPILNNCTSIWEEMNFTSTSHHTQALIQDMEVNGKHASLQTWRKYLENTSYKAFLSRFFLDRLPNK
jgi:hypothetical protein